MTAPAESLPFTIAEFESRLARLRQLMSETGLDGLLVTGPENIYYLTGYHTTGYYVYQALLVPVTGDVRFIVRRLELENVQDLAWTGIGHAFGDSDSPLERTAEAVRAALGESARLGYEDHGWFFPDVMLRGLREALPRHQFRPAGALVEQARLLKSPAEVAHIRKAAGYAVAGLEAGIAAITDGASENDVAGAVYNGLARAGSEYVGSQPYVVTGPRSAHGHATFERHRLQRRQMVFLEIGGCHRRYGGAIMRSVSFGPPSDSLRRAADASLAALETVLATARPGVTSGEVDAAARKVVEQAGLAEHWHHRTGYSIGVGFPPGWGEGHIFDLKAGDRRELQAGMCFHTVPMLLIPEIGAVGFSATFTVTAQGCEVLAESPRELRVAG